MRASNIIYPISVPKLFDEERANLIDAFDSSWISSNGKYIRDFEEKFARFIGVDYGVAVSNGTTAIHLALEALNIGENDEVIVPDLTFAATINAILHSGATPVIIDVNDEWCISTEEIKKAISPKTKAIIPVHIYGQPCNMIEILKIAKEHQLYVIEDCAEAHGAHIDNKKVGAFGDISCFSFFANKIITTGEGGICLTKDAGIAERLKILRDHGMNPKRKYFHDFVGYNYRMTNLQAAIGLGQLNKIVSFLEKRKKIEDLYKKYLINNPFIDFQPQKEGKVCWLVSVLVKNISRDKLKKLLLEEGIETRQFFIPLSKMDIYRNYSQADNINTLKLSEEGMNLPTYLDLNEQDIQSICEKINQIIYKLGEKR